MFIIPKKLTNEEFIEKLKIAKPTVEPLEPYVNSSTKIKVRHITCGYVWNTTPTTLLHSSGSIGCPKCGNAIKKTHDEFISELQNVNCNINILSEYKNRTAKIRCQCKIDNYIWEAEPSNLLQGHGCPLCSGRVTVQGVNDLLTTNPEYADYLVNIEDGFKYSNGSHTLVLCKCPNCGAQKEVSFKTLTTQGFGCTKCSDGVSYPNKFIREMLSQLPVNNVIDEYSPEWAKGRYYDNYFEYQNKSYILEADGAFHYKDSRMGLSFEEQQKIDSLKNEMALANDCIMIRIDCRKSDKNYIISKIKDSLIADLFVLDNIDWDVCDQAGQKSRVKEICLYYEKQKFNQSFEEIAEHFNIHSTTLRRYRQTGIDLGWCSYTKDEKKVINALFNNFPSKYHIEVYSENRLIKVFNSVLSCIKYMNYMYDAQFSKFGLLKQYKDNNCIDYLYRGYRIKIDSNN